MSFIYFGAFLTVLFCLVCFFLIFIFYHFLAFRRCSFSTSIYCCPCFNAILRFCGTHSFPGIIVIIYFIFYESHFLFIFIRPILIGFLKLLFWASNFFRILIFSVIRLSRPLMSLIFSFLCFMLC